MDEIIIIDTEFTTWEGAMASGWAEDWQHREVVQIAAIRLDLVTGEEKDVLDILVKPTINTELSDFFTQLTSITQEEVDEKGLSYPDAQKQLVAFCEGMPSTRIVTYGWDENVLIENCDIHGIDYPFETFRNLRFGLVNIGIDDTKYHSGQLHKLTDTPLEGHLHYALHDVRSMGVFIRYQIAQGHDNFLDNIPLRKKAA